MIYFEDRSVMPMRGSPFAYVLLGPELGIENIGNIKIRFRQSGNYQLTLKTEITSTENYVDETGFDFKVSLLQVANTGPGSGDLISETLEHFATKADVPKVVTSVLSFSALARQLMEIKFELVDVSDGLSIFFSGSARMVKL